MSLLDVLRRSPRCQPLVFASFLVLLSAGSVHAESFDLVMNFETRLQTIETEQQYLFEGVVDNRESIRLTESRAAAIFEIIVERLRIVEEENRELRQRIENVDMIRGCAFPE